MRLERVALLANNISLDKLVLRRHQLYEQLEGLMNEQLARLQEEHSIDTSKENSDMKTDKEDQLPAEHALMEQQEVLKNEIDTLQGQIQEQLIVEGCTSLEESVYSTSLKPIIASSQNLLERMGSIQQQILGLLKQQFDALTSDIRKTNQHKQVMNSYYNLNPNQQVAVYFDEKN